MTSDDAQLSEWKRKMFLERAGDADKYASTATDPNIAEQWRLIAGTWRALAETLSGPSGAS